MLSRIQSSSIIGISALKVEVEVDVGSRGLPHFSIVGLPDAAVKESRDRVRAALKNIGFNFPLKPITVNLAPADLRKEGSAFDLPIALGLAICEGAVQAGSADSFIITGELSLDGRVKHIRGALCMAMLARKLGMKLILPQENAAEAAVVKDVQAYGVSTLSDVIGFLNSTHPISQAASNLDALIAKAQHYGVDFCDVKGQEHAKRALEVAAAGSHNVLTLCTI